MGKKKAEMVTDAAGNRVRPIGCYGASPAPRARLLFFRPYFNTAALPCLLFHPPDT